MGRQHTGWGKWYWECKLVTFDHTNGCTVSVSHSGPPNGCRKEHRPALADFKGSQKATVGKQDGKGPGSEVEIFSDPIILRKMTSQFVVTKYTPGSVAL